MLLASPENKTNIQPVRVFDPNALLDSTFKLVPPPGSARGMTQKHRLYVHLGRQECFLVAS